ncbi:hypothetical protein V7S43_011722 [Phytophthora oleae]|uniref:RxLR effector protein n=1 Tax=Phytophthora oleae TaxID=2107226 RepID=A0ABD3F9C4_9STRA
MRLLFWTLLMGLAASAAHSTVALTKVSPTIVEGANRHLRLAPSEDTLFDRGLKADDEERGNFAIAAGWSTNKIFNGLGKIVGHDKSNKMKAKLGDFLFSLLRKKGKTADDVFALARKQTDPNKRAKFEAAAKLYDQYLKKPL